MRGSRHRPRAGRGPPKGGPIAAKRRQLSETEREERRCKERERLEQATAELLTSEGWRRWLRTRSVLHGYSLTNTLLIAQQCHARGIEPTYVAGFRAWLQLGRCVRKGEKGLRIWAPMRLKARDEHGEEAEERKLRFRTASVFDVSQTEPLPGVEPSPLSPPGAEGLGGDSHAHLLPALEQLATDSGYSLTWAEQLPRAAKGRCHRGARTIEVLAELPANDRVQVLIHELGHALVGERVELTGFSYGLEEVVVESATFVACASAGLATDVDSVPYIAGWSGEQEPAHVVREAADAIDTLARLIEAAIAPREDEEAAA